MWKASSLARLQSALVCDDKRDIFVGCETAVVNDTPEYIGPGFTKHSAGDPPVVSGCRGSFPSGAPR